MANLLTDGKLVELGRQFELALANARKLDPDRMAAFAKYEAERADANIPDAPIDRSPEHRALERKIYRDTGYMAASDAFNRAHGECIRLMKAIHRAKATTLEGFAVKVAAIAFDQSDFELGEPVGEDVAERELYLLARDMAKVVKTKVKPRADIRKLIDAFAVAKLAYDAATEDNDNPNEWDAYEAAEHAVIVYPCHTLDDVREKAGFFLDNYGPNDTLRNCADDTGSELDRFLRSLLGEAQP